MSSRSERANAIRVLSMDAVQRAKSGHPGAPMGMADIAEVLWNDFLVHNPNNPNWLNRDRFVLSNGHGSMLIYALLHLSGYEVSIEDIKNFRQLHAKTPGHPEYGYTPGVETTTGPLGQGLANAVGFALAERTLAAQFNRQAHQIIDHFTYAFVGDGCLMEGISHEVCSLAGTLELGKLIVFYDDNGISIDGEVEGWFTDNTPQRFESYGWQVIADVDGHNPEAITQAIKAAQSETKKPTLICCKTIIGKGSPNKAGQESSHGAPLGEDEIELTRQQLGWQAEAFDIPETIRTDWNAQTQGVEREDAWNEKFTAYEDAFPELAQELKRRINKALPENFIEELDNLAASYQAEATSVASRKASQQVIEKLSALCPELFAGSADLTGSNLTNWQNCSLQSAENPQGNYLSYGVREFGMAAIMNGMALYGGFIPFGGTFLVFMEYARNAVRMAALMKQRVIHVFTHDSIGLGEDGPTHQPIEQINNLRMTPNLNVWRPCDRVETVVAWKSAIATSDSPSALILSRQSLPHQQRDEKVLVNVQKGAYILKGSEENTPDMILVATGSEVGLAINVAEKLDAEGINTRVVSAPCLDIFEQQDASYKNSVFPSQVTKRLAIEAGNPDYWYKYVGLDGDVIGMSTFGESAPAAALFQHFGFTVDAILERARQLMA
ncbi:MAG: transketolase [Pseudomonadota bacterium]